MKIERQVAAPARFMLERGKVVPALIGRHQDFLIIAGLAGAVYEVSVLTNNADYFYGLGGAMGAACMMGLGLALAQPKRRVLVVTGDGELLMNLGSLCTIATFNPPNLSILCVDNGHYGETGYQISHTSRCVDLEAIAKGAGIKLTHSVTAEADIAKGARLLRVGGDTSFVLVSVKPTDGPKGALNLNGAMCRDIFRRALLGTP
jgi:thiamine pyrophosphate-dependent acetolactate synthase large subunit-like protein